jgi:excisionase family DNA binding protein
MSKEQRNAVMAIGRDLEHAAAVTGLSKFTVRLKARRGEIAHFKLGRRLVFRDADLEEYMRRHRVDVRPVA